MSFFAGEAILKKEQYKLILIFFEYWLYIYIAYDCKSKLVKNKYEVSYQPILITNTDKQFAYLQNWCSIAAILSAAAVNNMENIFDLNEAND